VHRHDALYRIVSLAGPLRLGYSEHGRSVRSRRRALPVLPSFGQRARGCPCARHEACHLQVMEETSAFFIAPRYVVRGALLVNTDLEKLTSTRYYVDDAFDNDMFLRLGN
jgi:hypothetical protein